MPRNLLADVLPPVASMRRRALHRRGKRGVRTCERHAKHRLVSRRRARGKGCDKNAPSDSATLARCAQTLTSADRRDSSTGTGQRPESPRVASHGAAKAHASNGLPTRVHIRDYTTFNVPSRSGKPALLVPRAMRSAVELSAAPLWRRLPSKHLKYIRCMSSSASDAFLRYPRARFFMRCDGGKFASARARARAQNQHRRTA